MLNLGIPRRRSPLARRQAEQLALPLAASPSPRGAADLHAAIVEMRHRGYRLVRAGNQHLMDGRSVPTRELWAEAARVGLRRCGKEP